MDAGGHLRELAFFFEKFSFPKNHGMTSTVNTMTSMYAMLIIVIVRESETPARIYFVTHGECTLVKQVTSAHHYAISYDHPLVIMSNR
jgi:hypothetical protein